MSKFDGSGSLGTASNVPNRHLTGAGSVCNGLVRETTNAINIYVYHNNSKWFDKFTFSVDSNKIHFADEFSLLFRISNSYSLPENKI